MNAVLCMPQKPRELGQNLGSMVGSFAAYISVGIPAPESRPALKVAALLSELDKARKAISSCAIIGKEMATQVRNMPIVVGEFIDADMAIPGLLQELRSKVEHMSGGMAKSRRAFHSVSVNFIQRVMIKHAFERVAVSYRDLMSALIDLEACIEAHDEACVSEEDRALTTPLEIATHLYGLEGAEILAEFHEIGAASAFSLERLRDQLGKNDLHNFRSR